MERPADRTEPNLIKFGSESATNIDYVPDLLACLGFAAVQTLGSYLCANWRGAKIRPPSSGDLSAATTN